MKFLLLISIIIGAIFLYSSINHKNIDTDTNLIAENSANWLTDFSEAKAKAKEEGKPILIDFTGSNWCGWCIKLKKEVFSKPAFFAPSIVPFPASILFSSSITIERAAPNFSKDFCIKEEERSVLLRAFL